MAGIKALHTLAWRSIESCVLYVLYAGLRGRTGRRVGIAGGIVAGEVLVFQEPVAPATAGNGCSPGACGEEEGTSLPASGGEKRIVQIAASLAAGRARSR